MAKKIDNDAISMLLESIGQTPQSLPALISEMILTNPITDNEPYRTNWPIEHPANLQQMPIYQAHPEIKGMPQYMQQWPIMPPSPNLQKMPIYDAYPELQRRPLNIFDIISEMNIDPSWLNKGPRHKQYPELKFK